MNPKLLGLLPVLLLLTGGTCRNYQPNVVLIVTDDQRWDTLGPEHSPYGRDLMPSVRRLAAEGVSYSNAFVTTPVCNPSRASILTGRYGHRHGSIRNDSDLPGGGAIGFDDTDTVAVWMQEAGYRTGMFGKYLNETDRLPADYVPPGWDDWRVFRTGNPYTGFYTGFTMMENGVVVDYRTSGYSTDVLAEQAMDFVESAVRDAAPFFAVVTPFAPHGPYLAAARHRGELPGAFPAYDPPNMCEADLGDKPAYLTTLGMSIAECEDQHMSNVPRTGHARTLQAVDEMVGDLLDLLESLDAIRDTLIIFTSDNGHSWGEHRWNRKGNPHEESLRVPLVVRYPRGRFLSGVPVGSVREEIVLNIDLAPTIAHWGRAVPEGPIDGQRLTDAPRSMFLHEQWTSSRTWFGLRTERWKFVEYRDGQRELYDVEVDPFELTNLAGDPDHAFTLNALRISALSIRPNWPAETLE